MSGEDASPQEVTRILEIIRMAFSWPNNKRIPADGKGVPKATLLLLQYLSCLGAPEASRTSSIALAEEIGGRHREVGLCVSCPNLYQQLDRRLWAEENHNTSCTKEERNGSISSISSA